MGGLAVGLQSIEKVVVQSYVGEVSEEELASIPNRFISEARTAVSLNVCLSVCLSVYLPVCLFVCLSVCPAVCLPVSVFVCLAV